MLSLKKIILTALIYYILLVLFPITKIILNFLVRNKFLTNQRIIEKILNVFFRFFAYHGSMKMDLERYIEVGFFRIELLKQLGQWKEQRIFQDKDKLKIGFLGVLGKEGLLSKEFFQKHPLDAEVHLYDMDQDSEFFNDLTNVHYAKTPKLKHYLKDSNNQSVLLKQLENDNLDVLVVLSNTYSLTVFDVLTIPSLISMNTTSTVMPHSKFKVQIYTQPGWNYSINNDKIKNIRKNKDLIFPIISNNFIFSSRATRAFNVKEIFQRNNSFYFCGGLEKIDTKVFLNTMVYLLESKPDTKFVYFGKYFRNELKVIEDFFRDKGVLERTKYGGAYQTYFDETGNLIDDGVVHHAYNELFSSRLFVNSFPIIGARSCIEAYFAQVPTVHLDLDENDWIKNQKLQPFKLPIILTKTGTARSVKEYQEKCLKVLTDDKFCQTIIDEQNSILDKVTNIEFFWNKILDIVEDDRKLKFKGLD